MTAKDLRKVMIRNRETARQAVSTLKYQMKHRAMTDDEMKYMSEMEQYIEDATKLIGE